MLQIRKLVSLTLVSLSLSTVFQFCQNTVEASTFGAAFIALKTCVEAIVHLQYKLRMFGIPLFEGPTNVMVDNKSVVMNSTMVELTLNKKHNSIAYHHTR